MRRYFVAIILALTLLIGCNRVTPQQTSPSTGPIPQAQNISNLDSANVKTPELTGGPEKENRTIDSTQISDLTSRFPKALYYFGPGNVKQAALTFDDGPDVYFTTQILDILKRNNVKGTFFIVGTRAEANPEMVKRIVADGHAIGNHTWDHPDLVKLTPDQIRSELNRTDQLLSQLVGYHPALFRPPYGATNASDVQLISSLGYKIIDWSVDTRDWAGTPAPQIMDYVHKEFRPGGIILEHCAGGKNENLSNTVTALPEIISTLKAQGYSFVTVPNLLNIPPAQS